MRLLTFVGLALVVLGILTLGHQGLAYVLQDQGVVVGLPLGGQEWEQKGVPWSVLGIAALVVGGLLTLVGGRHSPGAA